MLVCARAPRFPISNEARVSTASKISQPAELSLKDKFPRKGANPSESRRVKKAKPASFDTDEINAAEVTGAPSYTSGAQRWNGAAAVLKPNPTIIKMRLILVSGVSGWLFK